VSRSDEKRLDDIRRMCVAAADVAARGRASVEADDVLWLALERAIEIAGEAATRVSDETKAQFPDVEWNELAAVRVLLAHAYHRIDRDLLWGIVERDLPRVLGALDE
jgi:uncharacterized protein with HEPN domain